jgi:hypothetical protein
MHVFGVAFSPSGATLATAAHRHPKSANTVRIWDMTGTLLANLSASPSLCIDALAAVDGLCSENPVPGSAGRTCHLLPSALAANERMERFYCTIKASTGGKCFLLLQQQRDSFERLASWRWQKRGRQRSSLPISSRVARQTLYALLKKR